MQEFYRSSRCFNFFLLIISLLLSACIAKKKVISNTPLLSLENGFKIPPDSVKPSVYWYWLNGNISKTGVTRDLEAMAKVGIGRAFIGNIGLSGDSNVKLFSDEWWQVTAQAIKTGERVGVDIGMFNGPGWSMSGGPWIKPTESMRYLSTSEISLTGLQKIAKRIFSAKDDYQEVALLAYPAPAITDPKHIIKEITAHPQVAGVSKLIDGDLQTEVIFAGHKADSSQVFDIETTAPFTARSLMLYPAKKTFNANVELQVNEGGDYKKIESFDFSRSNTALNVGFMPYGPVVVSFPVVKAKKFRLIISNISAQGGLAEIKLSEEPLLNNYVEKQLGKMFPTPLPLWQAYQWPAQVEPETANWIINPSKVLNITKYLSKNGVLTWDVPKGNWILINSMMTPTGVVNAPASPEGRGLEVDKMSKKALQVHFDSFIGKILKQIPANERKALKYVVADSYENGSENWTDNFSADFKKEYNYDPLQWLPVLDGHIVGSAELSDRFLWDMRRLIANNIAYKYVGGLRDLSHKNGLGLWLENYGHWGFPAEFLQYGGQSDEVAGEFWNEGDLGSIELRAASSAAHIYGKNKVSAESFTSAGKTFMRYPALLKKRGDWSFTEGVNNTLLHVYITQPYEDRDPGLNAWFGTEFNRKNTWFNQSKIYIDYLRRCMFMLQQGNPVVDVAYFIGEDVPKMTGACDPPLLAGYSFDYINSEVIENRLKVKDGKLVLPDGISYNMLVLPKLETMRPALLRKIKDLVVEGAVILGPSPVRSPSLQNYPESDKEVRKLVEELWGNADGKTKTSFKYGKGLVLVGMDMKSALNKLNVTPDFSLPEKQPVLYTHRTTKNEEIYFVSNQSDETVTISPTFRVFGKQPQFWDAVTGSVRILPVFKQNSKGITVPLTLEGAQSGFIVFRNPVAKMATTDIVSNFPEQKVIAQIKGPWKVVFDPKMRGPENPVEFNELEDWTKRPEAKIENYSGTAVYYNAFNTNKLPSGQHLFVNLGLVGVMANVNVNGIDVGGVWTAPWQVDITSAVKPGKNIIEIKVVNTWVNRLIGDSKLPLNERKTWTNVNPYNPNSPYEPSGLIGPVTLQTVKYAP